LREFGDKKIFTIGIINIIRKSLWLQNP